MMSDDKSKQDQKTEDEKNEKEKLKMPPSRGKTFGGRGTEKRG
jgi:hypothetical protein